MEFCQTTWKSPDHRKNCFWFLSFCLWFERFFKMKFCNFQKPWSQKKKKKQKFNHCPFFWFERSFKIEICETRLIRIFEMLWSQKFEIVFLWSEFSGVANKKRLSKILDTCLKIFYFFTWNISMSLFDFFLVKKFVVRTFSFVQALPNSFANICAHAWKNSCGLFFVFIPYDERLEKKHCSVF